MDYTCVLLGLACIALGLLMMLVAPYIVKFDSSKPKKDI